MLFHSFKVFYPSLYNWIKVAIFLFHYMLAKLKAILKSHKATRGRLL